jgi:hypothetical protein
MEASPRAAPNKICNLWIQVNGVGSDEEFRPYILQKESQD